MGCWNNVLIKITLKKCKVLVMMTLFLQIISSHLENSKYVTNHPLPHGPELLKVQKVGNLPLNLAPLQGALVWKSTLEWLCIVFYFPSVMHFLLGFHLYLIISTDYPQFKSKLSQWGNFC